MSNPKYTPGPWTVINGNKYFPTVVMKEVEVPKEDIGTLRYPAPHFVVNCSHDQKMESIVANAKLIAAAPELLELLQQANTMLLRYSDGVKYPTMLAIEAAIKKATE